MEWDAWYANYIDINKKIITDENFTSRQLDRIYEMLRHAFRGGERLNQPLDPDGKKPQVS